MAQVNTLYVLIFSSGILLLYTYVLFPVLCIFINRAYPRDQVSRLDLDVKPGITATLIVSMRNEQEVAASKIKNISDLRYPNLEIIFVLDNCTDETKSIVNKHIKNLDKKVSVLEYNGDGGKNGGINRAVKNIGSDIIVFSDANSMYEDDALINLLSGFSDLRVGSISGREVRISTGSQNSNNEVAIWNLDHEIKMLEGRLKKSFSANGSMFALRRNIFEEIPSNVPNDLFLPLIAISKGSKALYCPDAICREYASDMTKNEYKRKKRIVNRAFSALVSLLFKLDLITILLFFSHKVLRWIGLVYGAIFIVSATLILFSAFFMETILVIFLLALLFFASAWQPNLRKIRSFLVHVIIMHLAALDGVVSRLCGQKISRWT